MDNKSKFLGMPHGTAQGRLRKAILFSLLEKHNENVCFRCENVIETVNELSIEHKERWENVSVDLFWDLDNIAFSHLKCNKPSVYHGGKFKRKLDKNGTAWCAGHQEYLDVSLFHKNNSRFNGLSHYCINCGKNFK